MTPLQFALANQHPSRCHSIPIDALAEIARKIPKIALIAGDQDTIVREADSIALHSWLPVSPLPKTGQYLAEYQDM